MNTEELCCKIAGTIQGGVYSPNEEAGFKRRSAEELQLLLIDLVSQIKKELRQEIK